MVTLLIASEGTSAMVRTISAAIAVGVLLIAIARRLDLPAIVLLLTGGVLLGPSVFGDAAIVQPETLGDGLPVLVSLAVGLILFEGGLTLDLGGYRAAPRMIKRLLTLGVLVTWGGGALLVWAIGGLEPRFALLAGAMVVVTGPTVIAPLLRRLEVRERLHNTLHWEGVLIDPIGVFLAVMCFEVVVSGVSGAEAATALLLRTAAGLGFGAAAGWLLARAVRARLVPEDMLSAVALAAAVAAFGLAEAVRPEAGLLAATTAGFVFALTGVRPVRQVRAFKAELTDLLIGTLFILLAARLDLEQFASFGWTGFATVLGMMFLVRPLAVLLCGLGTELDRGERLFLAWVAPRGIVAASIASLFSISIVERGGASPTALAAASFVETFVYSVIVLTVVGQGLTAGLLARALRLRREVPRGWMIVGAHAFGARVAEFLRRGDVPVVLVDTNPRRVREASRRGVQAIVADARDTTLAERPEWASVGQMLALTDNEDLNVRLCERWAPELGADRVFRVDPAQREAAPGDEPPAGTVVWPRLPRPGLLAAELRRGQATLGVEDAPTPDADPAAPSADDAGGQAVAEITGGRLQLLGGEAPAPAPAPKSTPADEAPGGPVRRLMLRRTDEHLLWSLRPELVLTAAPDVELRALFEQVLGEMIRIAPSLDRSEVVRELLDRESSFPTVLGHGVALPHAYADGLEGRLCAIVRIPEPGMRFDPLAPKAGTGEAVATPGGGVRLVFCLLSPKGDPEGHLACLAAIARLALDDQVRERLSTAPDPAEALVVVGEATGRTP